LLNSDIVVFINNTANSIFTGRSKAYKEFSSEIDINIEKAISTQSLIFYIYCGVFIFLLFVQLFFNHTLSSVTQSEEDLFLQLPNKELGKLQKEAINFHCQSQVIFLSFEEFRKIQILKMMMK